MSTLRGKRDGGASRVTLTEGSAVVDLTFRLGRYSGSQPVLLPKSAAAPGSRNVIRPARKCLRGELGCGIINNMDLMRLERLGP